MEAKDEITDEEKKAAVNEDAPGAIQLISVDCILPVSAGH